MAKCKYFLPGIALLLIFTLMLTGMPILIGSAADDAANGAYSELANPIATQEAKNIYFYLQGQSAKPGLVAGAFDITVNASYPMGNNYDLLYQKFGVKPGLYSTRYYWTGDGFALEQADSINGAYAAKKINDTLYSHYKDGAILLIHADSSEPDAIGKLLLDKGKVPAPLNKGDYDDAILYLDKTNPNCDQEASDLFWKYVKQWADALEDLESRGVEAYMFRPFVEMNTRTFYGFSEEGHQAFKNVWKQVYDYFYNVRKLKGCLLTFAPADYNFYIESAESFYPGNEYVDIVAPTRYTDSNGNIGLSNTSNYTWMSKTGKPFGFSEFSVRVGDSSVAANAAIGDWSKALKVLLDSYPYLSWVNTWSGSSYSLFVPDEKRAGNNNGEYFLKSPYTYLVDELPDFKNIVLTAPGVVQFHAQKNYMGSYIGINTVGDYNLSALNSLGINLENILSIDLQKSYGIAFFSEENCTGTQWPYIDSIKDVNALKIVNKVKSVRIFQLSDNLAYYKDVTASAGDQESIWKVNDGELSRWISNDAPTSWLVFDLHDTFLINRWVVKHAGVAGEDSAYNTSAYELQKSMDGVTWTTVSKVMGNTDNITDETVTSFAARYVRLYINKPNSTVNEKNRSCIAELELYGTMNAASTEPITTRSSIVQVVDPITEPTEEATQTSEETTASATVSTTTSTTAATTVSNVNNPQVKNGLNPLIPIGIGGILVIMVGTVIAILVLKKRSAKTE